MPKIKRESKLFSAILAIIVAALALAAIAAWVMKSHGSITYRALFLMVAPNTAVILLILSLLTIIKSFSGGKRNLSDFLILESVIIYAISVIMAFFMQETWHPEELLARINIDTDGFIIGSMSPITALVFILLSAAFLLIHTVSKKIRQINYGVFFLLWALLISYITIFAHGVGIQLLPHWGLIPMSLPTAIGMFILAIAILEQADKGFGYLFRYLSGHSTEDKGSINQLICGMFIVLVLFISALAIGIGHSEKNLFQQNQREQLSLGLDSQKNTLNSWINYHYDSMMEVRQNPDLTQGLHNLFHGDNHSQASNYALSWMHLSYRHHKNIIALFDAKRGLKNVNSANKRSEISLAELNDIQQELRSKEVYIQEMLVPAESANEHHRVQALRFWTAVGPLEDDILLLTEFKPEEMIQIILSKNKNSSGQNRSFLYSKDKQILHSISAASDPQEAFVRERIRRNLSQLPESGHHKIYDQHGAEYHYVWTETDHLPWILVNSINFSAHTVRLAVSAWITLGMNMLLVFLAALIMRQGSRKKAMKESKTALNEWCCTFDAIPDLIWLLDTDFHIIRSNCAVQDFFGISPQEALGQDCHQLLPGLKGLLLPETLQSGEKLMHEFDFNGRWVSCTCVAVMDENNTVSGYAQIISDHTDRKRTLEKLRMEEERFRAIFDQSPIGIFVISTELEYLSGNNSLHKILAYSHQELLGTSLLNQVHPDFRASLQAGLDLLLKQEEQVFATEMRFIRKDGSQFWAMTKYILIRNDASNSSFIICMLENIQERMEAMQELYRTRETAVMSEKLKSNFMQNISHEFRTPLNGIIGFSQILANNQFGSKEVQEYAGLIYKSGKRMQELIENILNFANINAGRSQVHKQEFNLGQMANKTYQLYLGRATSKSLQLICEVPEAQKELSIYSDEDKIIQIMAKLLDNAINFTEKGQVQCKVMVQNDTLLLQVTDTGIGIAKDKQERIFESFYQADMSFTRGQDGAGLGLSICQGLAKALDGEIKIESTPGQGTKVLVSIPVVCRA